jgi:hypothetical protein
MDTNKKYMAAFHGIQVYEILDNGNQLNGVYTNTELSLKNGGYIVDSEFARKKPHCSNGLEGVYDCKFIETDVDTDEVSATLCELKIVYQKGIYEFTWSKGNKPIYNGLGLMSGTTHIAVSYVKVQTGD